ncbi:MAG TPA: histidine kinase dimerization/phospho-acceptor domain-containing protein [bacterium]|nr:histidine kinase dimerization/phospho-acceptor domain-containing protein [bacterium]HPC29581.1 histidine kinase dimerization/phospho-acceptor domain-containing protein [bacterium]
MKYVMIVVEEKGLASTLSFLLRDNFLPVVVDPSCVGESIIQRKPDIIIIDFLYKKIPLQVLVEQIRKLVPDVPIIALVESFGPVARRLMNLGVYELVEKPFDPEKFMYALNRASLYTEAEQVKKLPVVQFSEDRPSSDISENIFFQRLSELLAENFSEPSRLIPAVVKLIKNHLSLSDASFFLKESNKFRFYDGVNVDRTFLKNLRFSEKSSLYLRIISARSILQKNKIDDMHLLSEIELLKAEIILPLMSRDGEVLGFFALGKRLTGETFSCDIVKFLSDISSYFSILLEDSFLFQENIFQKEFQKIILENVPTGIIVLDKNCNIKIFNNQAGSILGKNASDVMDNSIESIGVEMASKVREAISSKRAIFREEIFIRQFKKWFGMSCNFVYQQGEINWVIIIFQDITFYKEMEQEQKKIEQNQYWEKVASRLSHEIKNPLVAIKTFACLLPEKFEEETFRTEFYKIVNAEIERLTHLVDKIARLSEKEGLVLNKVDCFDVLQKTAKKFPIVKIPVSKNGINTTINIDAGKIQEALEFLFDFCCKDIGEDGTVNVSIAEKASFMEIVVEEKGNHLKLDIGQDIFVPFSDYLDGLVSLNLAICRKIIENHSGSISAEIFPEGKKRFTIMFPLESQ